MGELRQTALKKDIVSIESRLKTLEQGLYPRPTVKAYEETDETTHRIRREVEEIRQVLGQCLNEQQVFRAQLRGVPPNLQIESLITKEDLTEVEKKFNKKLGNAIDKLGNVQSNISSLVDKQEFC